jgi:hypothetical protein
MRLDTKREGIVVLNDADLNEYGDQVGGGWGNWYLSVVYAYQTAAKFVNYISQARPGTTTGFLAGIVRDAFGLVTQGAARRLSTAMRDTCIEGSSRYQFYDVMQYRLALGSTISEASMYASGRGWDPA